MPNKYTSLKIAALIAIGASMISFSFFKKAATDVNKGTISSHLKGIDTDKIDWRKKDDAYWKKVLDPVTYQVTRKAGTERPFTGKYVEWKKEGTFLCSNCGLELFSSSTKYKSGTGWPSFWDVVDKNNITLKEDRSFGMTRTELLCSRCRAHLGHVFNDGPKPTGLRYCINSVALNFRDAGKEDSKK